MSDTALRSQSRPAPTPTAVRLRRFTGGAALILFPAALVPQALIDPAMGGTGDVMVAAASEHRGTLTASAVLLLVSGILMAPAAAAILHQARDRGSALANAGAVLAVLGGFGHAGIAMFYLFALPLSGGNEAEMTAYVDRLNSTPAIGVIAFGLIMCFALGVLVLAWAAWRAGSVGIWAPAVVTGLVLVEEFVPVDSAALQVAGLAALTVVYGYLGLRVLRMSDTEWDGVRVPAPAAPVADRA